MLAGAVLAGCSQLAENKKLDYRTSVTLPPLDVPPDLTQPGSDERYVVPDVAPQGSATYSAYAKERNGQAQPVVAAASALLPASDKVRVERAGAQRWLVVRETPETLWPQIKQFLQDAGFAIAVEKPEAGILETEWAENRAKIPQSGLRNIIGKVLENMYSSSERDKFRVRLERGAEPGISEVYISHRGMEEVFVSEGHDQTRWQPRPSDPEMEAEMLRRLMVRFGAEEARADAQIVATQVQQAQLQQAAGGGMNLLLNDGFERAWRRVGLALERIGFTVEDRDRSQGIYFVRYADAEEGGRKKSKGLFARLKFWESEQATAKPTQFRINVSAAGGGSVVRVLGQEGGKDDPETAAHILNMLLEQLK